MNLVINYLAENQFGYKYREFSVLITFYPAAMISLQNKIICLTLDYNHTGLTGLW